MSAENLLSEMVEKIGLQAVAKRTGYSKSAICHVLRGTYKGKVEKVLAAVAEKFSQDMVACPVLGDIPFATCVNERRRPFAATNPLRVALARACPKCGGNDDR